MKILVFTTDMIPLPGVPTSGTALRTFGFAQGLKSHGHQVEISVPKNALQGFLSSPAGRTTAHASRDALEQLKELAFDGSNQQEVIARTQPEVILCGHWPAMTLPYKPAQTVIIDLAGPHLLERHYQKSPNQTGATLGKLNALSNADYFIVSGPSQRLYFLSFLLRAGIEQPENRIITVPMPLNPVRPQKRGSIGYPHFVFGGVFLPWQDPSFTLQKAAERITAEKRGRLTLIGGKHPNYPIKEGVYAKLFRSLSDNPLVTTKPMLPFEHFLEELASADVALDLMKWNLERQLAVTIRSTTYLWAGLPVIYNNFADLAQVIQRYDAGWCIAPEDPDSLSRVFDEIFGSPETVGRKAANASRLADEVFAWDKAVHPLLQLLGAGGAKQLRETDIIIDFPDSADFDLFGERNIEQFFLCRLNGLSRIEVRLATHQRLLKHPLRFRLFEVSAAPGQKENLQQTTRRLAHEAEMSAEAIQNNEWCNLEFPAVKNSAGKVFLLQLSTESICAEESPSPWVLKGTPYPLLALYYENKRIEHSALCFKTICSRDG